LVRPSAPCPINSLSYQRNTAAGKNFENSSCLRRKKLLLSVQSPRIGTETLGFQSYRHLVKLVKMQVGQVAKILLLCIGGVAVLLPTGCAVDNENIAKLPLFEAKSDKIPGLDSPRQRKKIIQEKGTKGAAAADSDKEIIVAQLVLEYQTSPDPNMRREAVDALAKIPHPKRDQFLQDILKDEDPFVRLSALEALAKTFSGRQEELVSLLIDRMKTDSDKDVRLAAIRILGFATPKDAANELHRLSVQELGGALYDKIPAIRYASMQSLQKITGKDYGNDITRWLQFVRYVKGEVPDLPAERKLSEKMPGMNLPMFK
jgi:hypothetical protein